MGEFRGKSAAFSTRITPELRAALEGESRRTGKSISQLVEQRLRESFREQTRLERNVGEKHVKALAYLVAYMATRIEFYTKARWHRDQFTNRALVSAITTTLLKFQPKDDMANTLAAIDEYILRISEWCNKATPDMAQRMSYMRDPEVLGMSLSAPFLDYPSEPPPLEEGPWNDTMYLMPFVWHALMREDDQ